MWCFYVVFFCCTLQGSHSDHSDLNLRHWNGFVCFPTDVFERIRGSNKAEVQLNNFWQNNRASCSGFPSLIPVKFRSSHSVSYSASPTHRGESNNLKVVEKHRTIPFVLNIIFMCLFFESLFQSGSKNRSKALNDTLPHKFWGIRFKTPLDFVPTSYGYAACAVAAMFTQRRRRTEEGGAGSFSDAKPWQGA